MKKYTRFIYLGLTVLWLAFIFSNSLKSGDDSTRDSQFFANILNGLLSLVGVSPGDGVMTVVRKGAHVTEFFLLGIFSGGFFTRSFKNIPGYWYKMVYILFTVLFAACIDEFIQMRIPERSSQITDVFIDFSGGIIAAAVWYFLYRQREKREIG